jgi:hypothetical protein
MLTNPNSIIAVFHTSSNPETVGCERRQNQNLNGISVIHVQHYRIPDPLASEILPQEVVPACAAPEGKPGYIFPLDIE